MKTIKFFLGSALLLLFVASCKPEYTAPDIVFGDSYAGIDGTWKLKTFTQSDLLYKAIDKPKLDLTAFWTKNGNPYTIVFRKADKTYTLAGDMRFNYMPLGNGTFVFNEDKNPSAVILTAATGEKITLNLLKPIRAEYGYNLELSQERNFKGTPAKPSISYNYTFIK